MIPEERMEVKVQSPATPKVSVIVPAYNAEKYLAECLHSIADQTMDDFEVIVVNDASTDSTPEIIRRFASEDSRFRLLTVTHGGLSHARNAGIDAAQGEYICFVDADDCCRPTMLARLLDTLTENLAQICVCRFFKDTEFGPVATFGPLQPEVFDYESAMKAALYQKRILHTACGVLFNREIVGDKRFRNGIWFEDLDAFYRFFEGADRIVYLPEKLYFYRQHPSSFMHRHTSGRLDVLDVTDRLAEYMTHHHPSLERAAADRRFSAHFNTLMLLLVGHITDPAATRRCRDVIQALRIDELTDLNVRFKNKCGALVSFLGQPFLRFLARFYVD